MINNSRKPISNYEDTLPFKIKKEGSITLFFLNLNFIYKNDLFICF